MPPEIAFIVVVAIAFIFGTPVWITLLVLQHRIKMKEMEYKRLGSPGLAEEVEALRHELAQLRETSTRFDMSYDAALDRLERRLAQLEGRDIAAHETYPSYRPTEESPNVVPLRRT